MLNLVLGPLGSLCWGAPIGVWSADLRGSMIVTPSLQKGKLRPREDWGCSKSPEIAACLLTSCPVLSAFLYQHLRAPR